jgi:UDP:flavonoid glycosyltransferase YjiC (YdhE family)
MLIAQVLVCSVPNAGHFNPMLTFSRHLAAAVHTILFYTAETIQSKVEASGFKFVSLTGKATYDYRRRKQLPASGRIARAEPLQLSEALRWEHGLYLYRLKN